MTGATGFLGRHLVAELQRRGHAVTALVRPSATIGAQLAGIDLLRADLRRPGPQLAAGLDGVDCIFHLAALSSGSWRAMFSATVLATENLLAAITEADWHGRLVHVSSFSVYGLNQVPSGRVVDETTPLEPQPGRRGDYAWTKSIQEELVRELAASGELDVVIVRPGAIYGRERAFVHRLGRPVGRRGLMLLGGAARMPLSYVENTASLLAECAQHPDAPGEVFNAVDPDPPTQREYLHWWRNTRREAIVVVRVPLAALAACRAGYRLAERMTRGAVKPPGFFDGYVTIPVLRDFRYATQKAQRVLGWSAPVPRDEAIRRTLGVSGSEGRWKPTIRRRAA